MLKGGYFPGLLHRHRPPRPERLLLYLLVRESKEAAIRRMERHGAEIVTTEMVVFEWLRSADHPQFRAASKLIR